MKKKQHKPDGATDLREKAERLLRGEPAAVAQMPEADLTAVLHELRVHQVELEMQNEELRRVQADLEESRSQYTDLFDFAPIGYLVLDPSGTVVQANLTAAALLNVDRQDLTGKPFILFVREGSRDTWRSHYMTLFKTGDAQESEIQLQRPDQALMVVRLRSEPVKNGGGKVVRCRTALTNVTALTRAEQRLRESEQRFRTLAENAPDIITRVDRQMHILYVNRPIEAALGIRPEEFVGRTLEELGVPEFLTGKWTATVNEVFQTARIGRLDFDCPTPQGLRHYSAIVVPEFAADRSVQTVLATVRDITERVQAEEKYSAVIRSLQDGFCILDAQGQYVEVNDSCSQMLGWSRDELLRMNVWDVWDSGHQEELTRHLQKAGQDGVDKFQIGHRRKDGRRLDCDITIQRLDADRFFVFARDITARRVAEEERMAALQRLELVARATNDGIWDWDPATDALWHNEALLTTFGHPADEPEGSAQWWRDHVHPQDKEAVLAGLEKVLRDGQDRWSARFRFRRHDGSYAWVMARGWALRDEQGKTVRMVGSMTDLSERLQLLDQLENEKGKLETILETASSAIIVVNEQGSIRYANPAAQKLHGQPMPYGGDLESHRPMGLLHLDGTPYEPRDLPLCRSALQGETYREVEMLLRRPDGETRHILVNTDALQDRSGTLMGAVAVIQDITELKRTEQALREARDQLEQRVHERTVALDETVATLQGEVAERIQAQNQLGRQNEILQTIIDSIPAMLVFYDAEGRVRLVNEEFTRTFGYSLTELQEAGLMELRYPDPAYRQEAREFIEAAQGGWRDFLAQCKNGDRIISSWAGVRLADGSLMEVGIDIRARHELEDRLRESEQRYRTLVELSPDAIGVEREGVLVFVNPTAAKLLGAQTAEEIVGRPLLDFIPPEHRKRVEREFKYLNRRRKPLSMVEEAVRRLDGVAVDIELSAIPIIFENQHANQIVLRDITHRKEIENRLRENARQLQQQAELLDLAHDSIVVNDMDGRIAFWNSGAEQTYGWTRAEAIGKISHELLQTRFPLNLIEITARLLSQGRWNGELTHTTRSGETIIVSTRWALQRDEDSRPTGILVIDRDITQQKRAELATREARQFAESVTNTVRESLLVLDRDLRVISANQTFYRQFATTPEETEGHLLYEIGNRQWDIPELRRLLEDILPHNTSFENFEVEHNFEGIGRRTMLLNARRIRRQTGETETILLAIEDITIRKEQERKIREHQEQLASLTEELLLAEERERRRIAVVLHDSIGQSLAFSKRELGVVQKNAPETIKEAIDYVKKQIDDAIRQTRNLTFELSPSTLHTFGLEAAVEELAEQFAQRANFRYHFEATDENQPLGEQIKTLLYRAARELLTNVAKHAGATDVSIRIERTDHSIRLTVQDNGKGLDAPHLERVMGQKQGFGLFSIRERLTYIGGSFEIESAPGRGTKVTLTAPLYLSNQGRLRSGKS
jgi:PAS domain S-box-containing protein